MNRAEFIRLQVGDIVRPIDGADAYVVTAHYGDRVTVVRTQDMTNPSEWVASRMAALGVTPRKQTRRGSKRGAP